MKNIWTLAKKELLGYFNSPIAYIFLIVFVLINSALYMTSFFLVGQLEMRSFFTTLPFILIVFIPSITMRFWAEERRTGTIELLLTLPIPKQNLIFGKFLAGFLFLFIALVSTGTIPSLLAILGQPDWGQILSGYLGALLLGTLFIAIGLFTSGLFKDQISAFILSLIFNFTLYMVGTDFIATFMDGWISGLGSFLKNYIGIPNHFNTFQKGITSLSDTYYFLSLSGLFIILNYFTLSSQVKIRQKSNLTIFAILLSGIALYSVMIVSDFTSLRIDWTRHKIHTLSPASEKILNNLKTPITISLYISASSKMPTAMKNIERDVQDKLTELKIHSSNVNVVIADPSENEELAKKLAERGIRPFQVQSIEEDALGVRVVYASIVLSYLDKKEEIISQIHPGNLGNLEYELMSKIYRLTLDKTPHVTIDAPFQSVNLQMEELMRQFGQQPPKRVDPYENLGRLLEQENYTVSRIAWSGMEQLPEDTQTLILIGAQDLNSRKKYEIDRFISQGKSVIFIDQKYDFQYIPSDNGQVQAMAHKAPHCLDEITRYWGVQWHDDIYFDTVHEVLSMPAEQNISGFLTTMVDVPVEVPSQIKILPENMNQEISITSPIGPVLYLWGSILKINNKKMQKNNLKIQTLFTGSQEAWTFKSTSALITSSDMTLNPATQIPYPKLAVLISGPIPTLYSHITQPPEWDSTENLEAKPKPSVNPNTKIILIGCSEMFNNNTLLILSNAHLFLNMVDALTLGDDLISIRGKLQANEYIRPVSKIEKIIYRIFVTFAMALFWILFGTIRLSWRRKSRDRYYNLLKSHEPLKV